MTDYMKDWCKGLRDMADFAESHEDLSEYPTSFTLNLFADDAEEMAKMARRLGTSEKHEDSLWYFLSRSFGPHSVSLNIRREEICERVQVGTKKVMKPAPDTPQVEVEEPVYEWSCPDSVLALGHTTSNDGPGEEEAA